MYIVNDITARNAIPAGDRVDGMQVKVLETGGLFVLRGGITNAHWVGPYEWETTADMEIYVNASTGNDATGTGAVGAPYATITRAYADVPYLLRHAFQIKIADGSYTAWPEAVENEFSENGQLVFDGVSGLTDDEGTLTVNTVTDIGGGTWDLSAYDVNVSGAAWTVNEHAGKFIRMESGAASGIVGRIWKNTADTLRILRCYGLDISAADTFTIGTPGVNITVADPSCIRGDIKGQLIQKPSGLARVCFGYINFITADFNIVGVNALLHGVTFATSSSVCSVYIQDAVVNLLGPFNDAKCFTVMGHLSSGSFYEGCAVIKSGKCAIGNSDVYCLSMMDPGSYMYSLSNGTVNTFFLAFSSVSLFGGGYLGASALYFEAAAGISNINTLGPGVKIRSTGMHFAGGRDCIYGANFDIEILTACTCDTGAYARYGLYCRGLVRVITDGAEVMAGSSGEIFFAMANQTEEWPTAVRTSVTDNHGSIICREP